MSTTLSINQECFSEAASRPSTLVELLRRRAAHMAEREAYTYLIDDEQKECFTYGELDRRARSIAVALQRQGATGERVLLLYPPGLEFIAAFFGCLYAGAVAVPAYPPRMNRSFRRLQSIVNDAQANFALTTTPILRKVRELPGDPHNGPQLERLRWLDTDALTIDAADDWRASDISPESLAFLQYTSGSTGTPKGVMLTHGNLLHNASLVYYAVSHEAGDRYVSWLPTFHDMGFMAGVLQPLYGGFEVVLMSPVSFLQSPFRWLQAISRYRGTTSGGPSFAYDLCAQKITAEQRATLDLSSWSVAFNGAEPIRADALERFTKAFEPCGFRRETFYPCYGLAEATLIVSGGRKSAPPLIKRVQARALERNRVVAAATTEDEPARALVGCGVSLPEQQVVIVNPESNALCAPSEVGEIWVSGPSVAQGYWNNPVETERTFRARPGRNGGAPFLRTGDLGFMERGELFVTGRLKDVIIIRGLNHYPQDIELTVEQSGAALRPGCGAAFSVEMAGEERLVLVQEVESRLQPDCDALIKNIRRSVSEEHEVQAHAVVLIKPKSIPKTSSGKIQRHACRAGFLAGSLEVIAEWRGVVQTAEAVPAPSATPVPGAESLEAWLRAELAARLCMDAGQIDAHEPIMRYGLDSLTAIELVHRIEVGLGINLPLSSFLESPSIAQLAAQVLEASVSSTKKSALAPARQNEAVQKLSHGQQALWFLHQMSPESAAYNLSSAMRVEGEVDVAALGRAFQLLLNRHAALRTSFSAPEGEPVQQVAEHVEFKLHLEDASTWSEAALHERLAEEVHRPFNLEQSPLLRVALFRRSASEHVLLISAHHIVSDFWSLAVLMQELEKLYAAEKACASAELAPLSLQYADYVRWQDLMLAGEEGERLWSYWREQLSGELPVLNLPADRPRPAMQTGRGAATAFHVSVDVTRRLKALAQENGATLYMTLLASFQALLYRYTGQKDLIVGSPISGRQQAGLTGLVGYFVNPLPLRADLSGDPTGREFIAQVRRTVLAAFKHQDYPFPLLVERLQPERDPSRSPLFQVLFTLQQTPTQNAGGLASLALAGSEAKTKLADLQLQSITPEQRVAQFDLGLTIAEAEDGLLASFQYSTDLFDQSTIERMAGHFLTLLRSIVENPDTRLNELEMLSDDERQLLLMEWNDTSVAYPQDSSLHQLFEEQAADTPDAIALVFDEERLSYGELNERANQVAHYLMKRGVRAERLVGICMERSLEMVIALLGIVKAGAAYLPLDPQYPQERVSFMLEDAAVSMLITQERLLDILPQREAEVICLDSHWPTIACESVENPVTEVSAENLAYVIYTSGSTGRPKGVMVAHGNVVNFCTAMDLRLGNVQKGVWLAVTSISFDISVLELLWTLARGFEVVIQAELETAGYSQEVRSRVAEKGMDFSLFYFASDEGEDEEEKYKLLIEGAKFADRHGFEAIWTPERHFHTFGALYPNPSVTSAAIAAITQNVKIRAGSVVLPLHHPVRVAEEWSVVDNLSHGRVGLSFASGWHADDFVLAPQNYADRKQLMFDGIEIVRKLWRGDAVSFEGGSGQEVALRIFPHPIQRELPVWVTAAGTPETFRMAGEAGANLLTHLLGQSLDDLALKIKIYRESWRGAGGGEERGRVTLMLHTFIGEEMDAVREKVRDPFCQYLKTSLDLIRNLARQLGRDINAEDFTEDDMKALLSHAFDRYFETSGLFGTPASCMKMIDRLKLIGVDEVACLIDFGVDFDSVMESLRRVANLRERSNEKNPKARSTISEQMTRHRVSHLQCTPSLARMLSADAESQSALGSLRQLMVGGEALPPALASHLKTTLDAELHNMYGPTETTIWSATQMLTDASEVVSIGRPVANTQVYLLDENLRPVPAGVPGELYIGGRGVVRGYLRQAELTASKFIPNPFGQQAGARLYRTGDLARYLPDGRIEFLGRVDHQVKVRGYRIELGEIEAVLGGHRGVRECIVTARGDVGGEQRLVAYVVGDEATRPAAGELRLYLKERLPEYMVPSFFVRLDSLPLTPNGKVDRKALPAPDGDRSALPEAYVAPRNALEEVLADCWTEILDLERIGIHDNFFEVGGHSLLATQLASHLRETLHIELPLRRLFEAPTVAGMAALLLQDTARRAKIEETAQVLVQLAQMSDEEVEAMLEQKNLPVSEGAAR